MDPSDPAGVLLDLVAELDYKPSLRRVIQEHNGVLSMGARRVMWFRMQDILCAVPVRATEHFS